MSEELDSFQIKGDKVLPNATAVLVLGILSLVTCIFYGVIGLSLSALFIIYIVGIILFFTSVAASTIGSSEFQDAFQQISDSLNVNQY